MNPPRIEIRSQWRWVRRMAAQWLSDLRGHEHLFLVLTALVVGALCGLGALLLHEMIRLGARAFWNLDELSPEGLLAIPWYHRLLVPALGGLAVGPLIRFLAPEARGHGVPEVIRAVAEREGRMRPRVVAAKALASALTLSSGGSAGREGPIIQIGAAIASSVGQLLRVSGRHLRILAGCGAAAGISATFNAPIAGALFAVEVILGEFGILQITPIVIAAVTATVVARGSWGNEPVFEVPSYQLGTPWELVPYAFLGVLCGLIAFLFIAWMKRVEPAFEHRVRVPAWLKPAIGGLLVGVIGVVLPEVYGDGYGTVNLALLDKLSIGLVAGLLVAKLLATGLTLGSGGSGGVFAPSLFVGAMAGALVGHLAQHIPNIAPGSAGSYALVGMGGLVAGAMHAPVTAMIMIFELTDNYTIILPLMVVCTISTMVSNRLHRESIYTWELAQQGVRLFKGRSLDLFHDLKVSACMRPAPPSLPVTTPAATALDRLTSGFEDALYLADDAGNIAGVIHLSDLKGILLRRDQMRPGFLAIDLAREQLPLCEPDQSLRDALSHFAATGLPELPVVLPGSRKVIGAIRHNDVVAEFNREILRRETEDVLARRMQDTIRSERAPMTDGFSLQAWHPPASLHGTTLAEAALPAAYHVQVVLIRSMATGPDGRRIVRTIIPDRTHRIAPDDTLVVVGRDENLARLPA